MHWLLEILVAVVMLLGAFLMVVASIGLIRFPDIYTRMHAAGKAGTLGILLLILAAVFFFLPEPNASVHFRGPLAIFFQFITTPAAVHLLARAIYVTEYPLTDRTSVDELKAFLAAAPDEDYGEE